ncbi:multidrug DMT transporter permease [Neptuniibacter halophilus]|uniref:multidrug DMT transporter permease n=1 Tax=Neptuniibacter halophilus TaxID=651666 RepID=UPI00257481E2|nr:multidrug DMT transporter permease [Neptuniibacter halophilus]
MSLLAALLLTVSALLHAGWNLLGKKVQPSTAFFLLANSAACLAVSPLLLIYYPSFADFPFEVWWLILLTGAFQAVYMWGLAGAYRHGAISVAYPLLRSLPILFVALFASMLNQGSELSLSTCFGMLLIASGCFLIPIPTLRHIQVSTFVNRSCLFALISAAGTVGYTLTDDRALALLRNTQESGLSTAELSLLYLLLESISCSLWLLMFVLTEANGKTDLRQVISVQPGTTTITGLAMIATYYLVLISMAYVDNVSYVVGFRQLSIPIAVLLGIYLFNEYRSPFKLIGTAATFTGIVMISL